MKLSEASKLWLEYHRAHSKENSIRAYKALLGQLDEEFENVDLEDVTVDKILPFINRITEGKKPTTKRTRYSHLLAFFNFIKGRGHPLRPHDLRRHAATYASRSGVPIEIISKVILRHANLSTTERYLGKISDTEAMRWIDNLYT